MKALATESRRHRGKAFFLFSVAIFFHGKGKEKALLRALRVLRGSLLFRAFCDALEGECYKWDLKRRESQRHKVQRGNTARWLHKLVDYGWLRLNNKPELLLIR